MERRLCKAAIIGGIVVGAAHKRLVVGVLDDSYLEPWHTQFHIPNQR
jgi:hypothetical protein